MDSKDTSIPVPYGYTGMGKDSSTFCFRRIWLGQAPVISDNTRGIMQLIVFLAACHRPYHKYVSCVMATEEGISFWVATDTIGGYNPRS